MSLQILPLNLLATLVVAIDNFPQASLIMSLQILVNNRCLTPIILAVHFPEITSDLMRLYFSTLQSNSASFLKQTLSFIRALNNLERATLFNMLHHTASLDALPAIILALHFEFNALIHDVFVHACQGNHESAVQDAVDDSVRTLVLLVLLQVFSDNFAAQIAYLAGN